MTALPVLVVGALSDGSLRVQTKTVPIRPTPQPLMHGSPCDACDRARQMQRSRSAGEDCIDDCTFIDEFEDVVALAFVLAEQVGHKIRHATPEARREQIARAADFIADELHRFDVRLNDERFGELTGGAA